MGRFTCRVEHVDLVGGTPAGRMILTQSKQLFIGHHIINEHGDVSTIQPMDMPARLAVDKLFHNPVRYEKIDAATVLFSIPSLRTNLRSVKCRRIDYLAAPGLGLRSELSQHRSRHQGSLGVIEFRLVQRQRFSQVSGLVCME
jgi:hypothetical protein